MAIVILNNFKLLKEILGPTILWHLSGFHLKVPMYKLKYAYYSKIL